MDLDFAILTIPRSGSHMLASALNSHPDIKCGAEYNAPAKIELPDSGGKIEGCIVHWYNLERNPKLLDGVKIIVLIRNPVEIAKSWQKGYAMGKSAGHYLEPTTFNGAIPEPEKSVIETIKDRQLKLLEYAKDREVLRLDYEKLTGNKDIREIENSKEICKFLNVKNKKLNPLTYKPMSSSN